MAKLTAAIEDEVLTRAGSGMSADAISAWLKAERGVNISGRALRKRLSSTREERSEFAKAVVAEKVTKLVGADLDALVLEGERTSELTRRLFAIAAPGEEGANVVNQDAVELYLKAVDRLEKLTSTRLKFAGLEEGKPIETVSDDELRSLAKKALKLLEGA